jgi:hypothetical protein
MWARPEAVRMVVEGWKKVKVVESMLKVGENMIELSTSLNSLVMS